MNVCIHRRQHYNDNVTYRIVRISVQSFQCNYYYREDDRQRRHIITCAATADRIRSSIYSVRLAVAAAIATSQMVVFCCLLRLTICKYIYISLLPTNPKTKYAIKAVNISIMRWCLRRVWSKSPTAAVHRADVSSQLIRTDSESPRNRTRHTSPLFLKSATVNMAAVYRNGCATESSSMLRTGFLT